MTLQEILSSLRLPHGTGGADLVYPPGWCDDCNEPHACPRCHDGRFLVVPGRLIHGNSNPTWEPPRRVPCSCTAADTLPPADYLQRAGLEVGYHGARVDTWQPETDEERGALDQVIAYVSTWPPVRPFLLLTGNKGTGKTHLAAAALWEAYVLHGVRGRFEVVPDLLARMRATYEQRDEDNAPSIAQMGEWLQTVPLLVLDDLGLGNESPWVVERLYLIVNARYNARRPTIVTTNRPLGSLDGRLVDRLGDWQVSTVVPFTGRSRRLTP